MSNPPSWESEPDFAEVFARLADVPMDALDKLIESTESAYTDLNHVRGHGYWGGLVLQQGAALKSLREARECLAALHEEAVGARNTELGITVATAVADEERRYAHTRDDKAGLVEWLLGRDEPQRAARLFAWDRPYTNDEVAGPYEQMRVVLDPDSDLGVLNYTEEGEDGELASWHSRNPAPPASVPTMRFDVGSALIFPSDAVLPVGEIRAALLEFAEAGGKPQVVEWQRARWAEPSELR